MTVGNGPGPSGSTPSCGSGWPVGPSKRRLRLTLLRQVRVTGHREYSRHHRRRASAVVFRLSPRAATPLPSGRTAAPETYPAGSWTSSYAAAVEIQRNSWERPSCQCVTSKTVASGIPVGDVDLARQVARVVASPAGHRLPDRAGRSTPSRSWTAPARLVARDRRPGRHPHVQPRVDEVGAQHVSRRLTSSTRRPKWSMSPASLWRRHSSEPSVDRPPW